MGWGQLDCYWLLLSGCEGVLEDGRVDHEPYDWYLLTSFYFYFLSLILNRSELVRLG
jgi:hypothetical protein